MRRKVNAERLEQFMTELASGLTQPVRVFLVGGASAVLLGWRDSTIDIDLKFMPESDELFRKLPALKELLEVNVELAAPDDFIPPLPGWEERSRFIKQIGKATFLNYDFYSQALAKIERGHEIDRQDVINLIDNGFVDPKLLLDFFNRIEADLFKYPSLDATSFRKAVEAVVNRSVQ